MKKFLAMLSMSSCHGVRPGADEEAVFAFLRGDINLYDIYEITEKIYSSHNPILNPTIDEIFDTDIEIREKTRELVNRSIKCLSI